MMKKGLVPPRGNSNDICVARLHHRTFPPENASCCFHGTVTDFSETHSEVCDSMAPSCRHFSNWLMQDVRNSAITSHKLIYIGIQIGTCVHICITVVRYK